MKQKMTFKKYGMKNKKSFMKMEKLQKELSQRLYILSIFFFLKNNKSLKKIQIDEYISRKDRQKI